MILAIVLSALNLVVGLINLVEGNYVMGSINLMVGLLCGFAADRIRQK